MSNQLSPYTGLPKTAEDIPAGETVRNMPYVRFIAESLCVAQGKDPKDGDVLQEALWRVDAMPSSDVNAAYDASRAALDKALIRQPLERKIL